MIRLAPALAVLFALAACSPSQEAGPTPDDTATTAAPTPSTTAAAETLHFTGTEPFWGGEVTGTTLTYSTPENIDGTQIAVTRMDGMGGFSFSGTYEGQPFDMAVSEGTCSDGMSDTTYPYTVTLMVQGEQRNGCGWDASHPKVGGEGG